MSPLKANLRVVEPQSWKSESTIVLNPNSTAWVSTRWFFQVGLFGWTSWLGQWWFKVICWSCSWRSPTPLKTNRSPENQWLEDVFPTKIVPFQRHVSFQGCNLWKGHLIIPKGSLWTTRNQTPIGQRLRFPATQDMSFSAPRPRNSRPRPPANCPCAPSKRPRSYLPRSTGRVGQRWSRKIHEGFKGFLGELVLDKKRYVHVSSSCDL